MVRDIALDVNESDIILGDKSGISEPTFNVEWDGSTCRVVVPGKYASMVKYTDGVFTCCVKIPYKPFNGVFTIAVYIDDDESSVSGGYAYSYLNGDANLTKIRVSWLPLIDINGTFRLVFNEGSSKILVYSSKESDIEIAYSDNQSAQLLALCAPGKNYRYPTTGIDITKYLNTVVEHTDLKAKIQEQYESDGKMITGAEFDSSTGDLRTSFSPETEQNDDIELTPVNELNTDFLSRFTDDYVRLTMWLERRADFGPIFLFNNLKIIKNIIFRTTQDIDYKTVVSSCVSGILNEDMEISENNDYCTVELNVSAGSTIIFNMPSLTSSDEKVFFVNSYDVTDEFSDFSRDFEYNDETYVSALPILKNCIIRYSIPKSVYDNGEGIFVIKNTANNIDNMLAVTISDFTDKIFCYTSETSNFSDSIVAHIISNYQSLYNELIASCFANGVWIDEYPWTDGELWKDEE